MSIHCVSLCGGGPQSGQAELLLLFLFFSGYFTGRCESPSTCFCIPHVSVCVSSLGEWEGGDKKAQVTEAWQ